LDRKLGAYKSSREDVDILKSHKKLEMEWIGVKDGVVVLGFNPE